LSLIFLLNQLGENRIKLLLNEPMRNHTTFKIGGIANVVICPSDTGELVTALKLCKENSLSSFVMGNGSNLLFDDNGTQKVIIKTKDNCKGRYNSCSVRSNASKACIGCLRKFSYGT